MLEEFAVSGEVDAQVADKIHKPFEEAPLMSRQMSSSTGSQAPEMRRKAARAAARAAAATQAETSGDSSVASSLPSTLEAMTLDIESSVRSASVSSMGSEREGGGGLRSDETTTMVVKQLSPMLPAMLAGCSPSPLAYQRFGRSDKRTVQRTIYTTIRRHVVTQRSDRKMDFDSIVKRLLDSWQKKSPTPDDFITAAIIIAAREGFHFSTLTRLPARRSPPKRAPRPAYWAEFDEYFMPSGECEGCSQLKTRKYNTHTLSLTHSLHPIPPQC